MVRFADWVMDAERRRDRHVCQSPDAQGCHCWWCADCPHDACCTSTLCADAARAAHPTSSYTTVTGIPEQGGIVYGVNGVCHQIANRILYPSAQIVSHAHGYWLSVSVFGTYGTNVAPSGWLLSSAVASAVAASAAIDWQSRMFVHQRHDDATGLAAGRQQREIDYLRRVRSLYAEAHPGPSTDGSPAHTELHTRELDLMFEYRLGSTISRRKLRELRHLHRRLLSRRPRRGTPDSPAAFDPHQVAARINRDFRHFSADVATVLGTELFDMLYAFPPDRGIELVSPRILANVDAQLAA